MNGNREWVVGIGLSWSYLVKASKIYVVDLGGRKLGSFFGTKKRQEIQARCHFT